MVINNIERLPSDSVPAQLSSLEGRSFVITPIRFKECYYGVFVLGYQDVGHFRDADIHFFEGLTQQLASTIYRLETARERQEFGQRAREAEAMSSIGQIAFELTHRWGNDLGLVRSYVNDIRSEVKSLGVMNPFIDEKLENIVQAAGTVLNLSKELKQAMVHTGEAMISEPVVMAASVLLEEAQHVAALPSNIQLSVEIDDDVAYGAGYSYPGCGYPAQSYD